MKKIKIKYLIQQVITGLSGLLIFCFFVFAGLEAEDNLIALVCGAISLIILMFTASAIKYYQKEKKFDLKCYKTNKVNYYVEKV